ncbi:supressor of overexpression of CONSTANS1 [Cinnamomum micranthum f. kanehirae]|uniref:Supressor of overexpression of CONSTANS1 n=1 Tax=Cinnamomum micranthum f. kanehirae TaxID=337451 RepID=A0A443PAQ3_9MAGN|nr:supressor of overexpression of CONSTANS1 [Cinnamomum micranthum f. kanehirae]
MQQWKFEAAHMAKKIEHLELSIRKLSGESLESCLTEELRHVEHQLEQSLINVRKSKERILSEENTILHKKCTETPQQPTNMKEAASFHNISEDMEVETELLIGRPERGPTRNLLQG